MKPRTTPRPAAPRVDLAPYARMAGRALLVGVTTALTQLNTSGETVAWRAVLVAGVLAAVEVLTPLNPSIGKGAS